MRWKRGGVSRNIEDRRAQRGGQGRRGFPGLERLRSSGQSAGRVGLPLGGGRLGLGGLVLVMVFLYFVGGSDIFAPGGGMGVGTEVGLPGAGFPSGTGPVSARAKSSPQEDELVQFVSFVLDDVQSTWARTLRGYREAKLVLYRDTIDSGCGYGQAAMGPFYCPADEKVYVDLSFYQDLRSRFGAPGDFAQAYVLAHEIGHHIQQLTGIESRMRQAQRSRPDEANALSVRLELQADCLAGVWAHSTDERGLLESGDVEEGLGAAAAVGDDRIQKMSGRGRVHPESFTHGSSRQRVEWFRRGLATGDVDRCDTFGGAAER